MSLYKILWYYAILNPPSLCSAACTAYCKFICDCNSISIHSKLSCVLHHNKPVNVPWTVSQTKRQPLLFLSCGQQPHYNCCRAELASHVFLWYLNQISLAIKTYCKRCRLAAGKVGICLAPQACEGPRGLIDFNLPSVTMCKVCSDLPRGVPLNSFPLPVVLMIWNPMTDASQLKFGGLFICGVKKMKKKGN